MTPRRCAAAGIAVSLAAARATFLAAARATFLAVAWAAVLAALPAAAEAPTADEARAIERDTRRALENGRALWLKGRPDAAERVLRRGLRVSPQDPALERALAHVLETLERPDEARNARARADARASRRSPTP